MGQFARLQSNWLGRYYRLSKDTADGNVDDGDQLRLDDGGGGQTLGGEAVWPDLGLKASCIESVQHNYEVKRSDMAILRIKLHIYVWIVIKNHYLRI